MPWALALCFPFLPLHHAFFSSFFCCAPPLSLAFSGFWPRVPRAWALSFPFLPPRFGSFSCAPVVSVFLWFRALATWALALCVVCFVCVPLLGSSCALAAFVFPAWPLAAPWWFPPPPFLSRGFRRCRSVPPSPFFSSAALLLPAGLALVGVLAVRSPPPPLLLFVCWTPAARLSVRSWCFCVSCLAVCCSVVVAAAPPPPPFCDSRCSLLPLGARFLFFSLLLCSCLLDWRSSAILAVRGPPPNPGACVRGALDCLWCLALFGFAALRCPSVGSCAVPCCRVPRWVSRCGASPCCVVGCCAPCDVCWGFCLCVVLHCWWLLRVLPCLWSCRLVGLLTVWSAVWFWTVLPCAVLCCVSLGAVLRRAAAYVPPSFVLSCAVLFCCACLVPLLDVACPLVLPVALGPCAVRRCILPCSPALSALCCVCFVVACLRLLFFAAVLCALCVLGCRSMRSLSSQLCAVLCCPVLVRLRCAVRVVCAVAGTWCCGALQCDQVLALNKLTEQDEKSKKQEIDASNLHPSGDLKVSLNKKKVDERIKEVILHFSDIFGPLPPPGSVKELVTMDLELREDFLKDRVRCRPYPASKDDMAEITRQIKECMEADLV